MFIYVLLLALLCCIQNCYIVPCCDNTCLLARPMALLYWNLEWFMTPYTAKNLEFNQVHGVLFRLTLFSSWSSCQEYIIKGPGSCSRICFWQLLDAWRIQECCFYTPVWKNGTYYAVAMSVRPAVCPAGRLSVRPSTWHIHLVDGVTRQVRVSFQSGHFDLLYCQK